MEEEREHQYCPECGHQNPLAARFCMDCGQRLAGPGNGDDAPARATRTAPPAPREGTDWAGIVAAVLAFFSLRHMSRQARQTTVLALFLLLFFGCPLVCGFVVFVMEWFGRLFQ